MWKVHAVAMALDAWVDFGMRWRGGELDRVVGARHAAMHQAFAQWLGSIGGWELAPEVSFSIYGERGIIDGLAWHAATGTLLVVELKTELVDVSEILGTLDRKLRLAPRIARERDWNAKRVAGWLVVAESRTNRRRLAEHRDVLRAAFPHDGHGLEGWLRAPSSPVRALSFLPERHLAGLRLRLGPPKRVRPKARAGGPPGKPAKASPIEEPAGNQPSRGG